MVSSYIIAISGGGTGGGIQAGSEDGTLWGHKTLSPGEVVNQIVKNKERKHLPRPGRRDWCTGSEWYLRINYFCRKSSLFAKWHCPVVF